jgi:crotonobetainyl-CoA:carnitine CoA-transferase CaiB-like acyl-CoA transferase
MPPLKPFGHQGDFQGGVHAAFTTLAAYWNRLATGKGQAIDVSEQECIAAMLEMNFMHYTYAGRETSRLGQRMIAPWTMLQCSDGLAFVVCVEEDQWQRLVEMMGNPEWAREELFKDRVARGQNADALYALMSEWASTWKVHDMYREGQKRRIAFAPVNTMADLYKSEQLHERGFLVPFGDGRNQMNMPGAPSKYSSGGWSMRTPPPRLGEHNEEVFCNELGMTRQQAMESARGSSNG